MLKATTREKERERERVKSLRGFDLSFYNFGTLKRLFDGAFFAFQNYV